MRNLLDALGLLVIDGFGFVKVLQGGQMATIAVYENHDGDRICVKFLIAPRSAAELERFKRESQTLMELSEKAYARFAVKGLSDVRKSDDYPVHFFLMEHVDGDSLAALMERDPPPWSSSVALNMVYRTAAALSPCASAGFVHRDLHPGNVMIVGDASLWSREDPQSDPDIRLLDFGLAKNWILSRIGEWDESNRRHYGAFSTWSPEYLGEPAGVEPPHDVWALGVMFHRLLSGKFPFEANSFMEYVDALRSGLSKEAMTEAGTHMLIQNLVERMLADHPDNRISIRELTRMCFDLEQDGRIGVLDANENLRNLYVKHDGDIGACPHCNQIMHPFGSRCSVCGRMSEDGFIDPFIWLG